MFHLPLVVGNLLLMRHFTYSNPRRSRAKMLTRDEARRIAANVAKVRELLGQKYATKAFKVSQSRAAINDEADRHNVY
jgi:hypothetical protein